MRTKCSEGSSGYVVTGEEGWINSGRAQLWVCIYRLRWGGVAVCWILCGPRHFVCSSEVPMKRLFSLTLNAACSC